VFDDECRVEVRRGTDAPLSFPLMRNCKRKHHGKCADVMIDVKLPAAS
jgi:hypothetical protein